MSTVFIILIINGLNKKEKEIKEMSEEIKREKSGMGLWAMAKTVALL